VIPPFAEIEAHARAEVQAALDSTHVLEHMGDA